MPKITPTELKTLFEHKLASSALSPADGRKMKLQPTLDASTLSATFSRVAGFKIPYFTPDGEVDKEFYRLRYLEDTRRGFELLSGQKQRRYVQPPNTSVRVYFPPFVDWINVMSDPDEPLVITEGELKAACASSKGTPTIGLGGVWSFASAKRNEPLIEELAAFEWSGRTVYICYDSDAVINPKVMLAEARLADKLLELGAQIWIARLKSDTAQAKMGIDDYVAIYGIEDFVKKVLTDSSYEYESSRVLHQMNQTLVYVRDPGIIYDYTNNGQKLAPAAFVAHAYSDLWYTEQVLDAKGNAKLIRKPAAKMWMEWPARSKLDQLVYRPGQPKVTEDSKLNMWPGWGVSDSVKGDVSFWHEMLDHLMPEVSKENRRWFEQWCAYPIQHPGAKLNSGVLIWSSVHGAGKSMLGWMLMRLYGRNAIELKDEALEDVRNEWAENKQFVVADDITGSANRKHQRRLMTMITQKEVRLNPKYIPSYSIADCINYYLTSNDPDAVFLDDQDRRFFIHEVKPTYGKLPPVLRERWDLWKDDPEAQQALFYYLEHLDLTGFDPFGEAPMTDAKSEMNRIVKSELGAWVLKLKEEPDAVLNAAKFKGDLYTAEELYALFDPAGDKRASPNALSRELKRAGFLKAHEPALNVEIGLRRPYIIRNVERWEGAHLGEMIAHYNDHHPALKGKKF